MIQNVLRHLGGIENYGIISLCLFCRDFRRRAGLGVCLQKQRHLDRMARMPLETEPELPNRRRIPMNNDPELKDPLLLDHDYDGIQELDNKLPRWWVWLFNLCIVFAVIYLVYYHVLGKGQLMAAEYQARDEDRRRDQEPRRWPSSRARWPRCSPRTIPRCWPRARRPSTKLCAPCHRPDGGGLVGPNLCDDYWIHGSNFVDNLKTIWNGVPSKGMVTWKGVLKPTPSTRSAATSTRCAARNPKNPKPPEDQAPVKTGPSEFE